MSLETSLLVKGRKMVREEKLDKILEIKPMLIRVLFELDEAGEQGMSTREVLRKLESTSHAQRMLKLGEKKGYVRREIRPAPEGQKGGELTINFITEKGRHLVKKLNEVVNNNNNNG